MSETTKREFSQAAELLRSIAKDYFKLAKTDPRYAEHYNLEGKRVLKIAEWYFNRSKTNAKFGTGTDSTGAGNQHPPGTIPSTIR
jgi:hypothetical protein